MGGPGVGGALGLVLGASGLAALEQLSKLMHDLASNLQGLIGWQVILRFFFMLVLFFCH